MEWDKLYYCYAPQSDVWSTIAGIIAEDAKDAEEKFSKMNLPVALSLCIIRKFGAGSPVNGEKKAL